MAVSNKILTYILAFTVSIGCTGCSMPAGGNFWGSGSDSQSASTEADQSDPYISYEGYELKQVVVLSRHNIRSPLSGGDSLLGKITPHKWFRWTSEPSELSLKGGALETQMGQYFRLWAEEEKLIPDNYQPYSGEVRIYANSKQRTIATAQYFTAGMFPVAGLGVEYHEEFDKMDPVFNPQLTFVTDDYVKDATAQIYECYGDAMTSLSDNYELLADVIDIKDSEGYKSGSVTDFGTGDEEFTLTEGKEPTVSGSLKNACSVSDALVLQYYEESDPEKAGFGSKLTSEQWESIAEIKDVYGDVLFTAPLIAANVAHPLVCEIYSELRMPGRVFTFLCGHDSNVGSVLASLGAEDYELPGAIEKKTPIGCKLVFSKWKKGKYEFWSVDLVYESTDQLRDMPMLDLDDNSPEIVHLSFKNIEQNEDGLYPAEEFYEFFKNAMNSYESLYEEYGDKAA